MLVYEEERKLGFDASSLYKSIAYECTLTPCEPKQDVVKASILPNNNNQVDLFWLESVLASIGWNNNDDIFTPRETWLAKSSPINKPINYMHDNQDIIGHMISSTAVSGDKVIDENVSVEELPENFDVITAGVLYKIWDDEAAQNRMNKILGEISQGLWKVSMECRLRNFDYGLIAPDGSRSIIERTPETSFLTQFLRVHGGKGVWKEYKIGRLLRNFIFTGKGLVNNPANKRSLILSNDFAKANKIEFSEIKENKMADDNKLADAYEKTIAEIKETHKSELSRVNESLKAIEHAHESRVEALGKEVDSLKAEASERSESLEAIKAECESVKAEKEKMAKEKDAVEKDYSSMKEKVESMEKELAALKSDKVKAERVAKAVQAGLEEDKVEGFVTTWASVSDEQYDSLLETITASSTASASDLNLKEKTGEQGGTVTVPAETDNEFDKLAKSIAESFTDKGNK